MMWMNGTLKMGAMIRIESLSLVLSLELRISL
jgi:hypothetical protein